MPNMISSSRALSAISFAVSCGIATALFAGEAAVTEEKAAESTPKAGSAKKETEPQIVKLADGKLELPVPGNWKAVKPKSRIVQHEFAIAPAKSDDAPGRMTIMAAGGGVEANIARWEGQFKSADGGPLGDDAKKIEKKTIGDLTVHVVDLTGDFQDSPRGPFGPKVSRPDYRMLAAIVPLSNVPGGKGGGTWFIKTYGPRTTMNVAEKDFAAMVEGMKLAE